MKLLHISTRGTDFLNEVLYSGFKEARVDVYDLPYKPLNHAEVVHGRLFIYDTEGSVMGEESEEDGMIHFPKGYFGSNRALKWECSTDLRKTNLTPFKDEVDLDYFDEIIIGGLRRDNLALDIASEVYSKCADRVNLVDGYDDPFIRSASNKTKLYFKRELMKERNASLLSWFYKIYPRRDLNTKKKVNQIGGKNTFLNIFYPPIPAESNILPINLSINNHTSLSEAVHSKSNREYDISFLCSPNTKYRIAFSNFLRNFAKKERLKIFIANQPDEIGGTKHMGTLHWNKYVEIIKSTKVSVSLPGGGFDTARYWEIPYYGSVLASPPLPINIPNNFEDGKSAIFFDSYSEFISKVRKIIHDGSWFDIAEHGKKVFTQHHSSKQRAQTVLEAIAEK